MRLAARNSYECILSLGKKDIKNEYFENIVKITIDNGYEFDSRYGLDFESIVKFNNRPESLIVDNVKVFISKENGNLLDITNKTNIDRIIMHIISELNVYNLRKNQNELSINKNIGGLNQSRRYAWWER